MQRFCFLLLCLLSHFFIFSVVAQKKKDGENVVQAPKIDAKDNLAFFPNIGKITRYYNEESLLLIKKAEEEKNYKKTHELLLDYVLQFGIENFYKDTYLFWKLGQLAEKFDYIDQAKNAYRYILKHHRSNNIEKLLRKYDSLTYGEKDNYIPLEYYYQLVEARKALDSLYVEAGIARNLGYKTVNDSLVDDYAPTLRRVDDYALMLFTSKRTPSKMGAKTGNTQTGNKYNEDIFLTKRKDTIIFIQTQYGKDIDTVPWTRAEPLKSLNTDYNEGSACISRDGNTIVFSRCGSDDGFGSCDLFIAQKQPDNGWEVKNMGMGINSISWDSHPSFSPSEDTLYFASDRLGGFGMSDIYFTYKIKDSADQWRGLWAKPQNMGPTINTRNSDLSPFHHPNYPAFYFSSNGHLTTFGKFDIYITRKKEKKFRDSVATYWEEPKNTGPFINHVGDEYYFSIFGLNPENMLIYFAKADTSAISNMDIYSFPLPMEAQPTATTIVEGVAIDSLTGEALKGIVSIIDLDDGIEVAPKFLDEKGQYQFDLIRNKNYLVIITGDDFFRVERQFLLKGDTTINIGTPKFKKWEFSTIEFQGGKWEVSDDMKPDLDKVVTFLVDHPNLGLRIAGHTDSDGDAAENKKLSQKRADAIKEYVCTRGKIKPQRIESIGYGSEKPIITQEKSEEDKKVNRRVEFEIIKIE
ncbi:MAG: OmpA family protein [Cytophagales bacterium]|nr:MAG: OmpA family protein [Cytophagales bacterium]